MILAQKLAISIIYSWAVDFIHFGTNISKLQGLVYCNVFLSRYRLHSTVNCKMLLRSFDWILLRLNELLIIPVCSEILLQHPVHALCEYIFP